MANADYRKLIDALCEIGKIDPSPTRHRKLDFMVDGSAVTVLPSGFGGEVDALAYFVDFGALPEEGRQMASARLLETNLFMVGRDSPAFCINPDTGHALLAGCIPLDRITAESVLQLMESFAEYAAYWRDSHFLDPEDAERPEPAGTHAVLRARPHP